MSNEMNEVLASLAGGEQKPVEPEAKPVEPSAAAADVAAKVKEERPYLTIVGDQVKQMIEGGSVEWGTHWFEWVSVPLSLGEQDTQAIYDALHEEAQRVRAAHS